MALLTYIKWFKVYAAALGRSCNARVLFGRLARAPLLTSHECWHGNLMTSLVSSWFWLGRRPAAMKRAQSSPTPSSFSTSARSFICVSKRKSKVR